MAKVGKSSKERDADVGGGGGVLQTLIINVELKLCCLKNPNPSFCVSERMKRNSCVSSWPLLSALDGKQGSASPRAELMKTRDLF